VARSYNGTLAVPVSNPTTFVLSSFERRLQEAGIDTDLTLIDIDDLEDRPDRGSPLFVEFSRPLAEIAAVMNKESNNFYAEQVFRSYGWGGSARGAARRTKSFLREAGVNTRQLLVHDGSGLSRKDLITPQAMVKMLTHMNEHEEREAFLASLPRGGEYNTTLDYRLHRTDVQAKTGSLEFVRALSGYTKRANGNRVAFAVFANNYTGPSYQISRTIDDIVRAVASSS
jgi:D-alanyl-D-alanine carboxypeptidase/D-alanyl-D-alanine-endopeptidase (penicillin-binding protein 4)